MNRRRAAVTAASALLALAGTAACRTAASVTAAPSTGPPCVTATGTASPARVEPLPDIELPCLDGGAPVRLAALGRPAVVNLWASWCAPCRTEMPAIQRYAEHSAGRVTVIGVDTSDTTSAGRSVVHDLGVRYPVLFDQRKLLLTAVGRTALPVTLFMDATGRITFVYNGQSLTEPALAALAHEHLGVPA